MDQVVEEKCEMVDVAANSVEHAGAVVEEAAKKLRNNCERRRSVAKVFDKADGEVHEAGHRLRRHHLISSHLSFLQPGIMLHWLNSVMAS